MMQIYSTLINVQLLINLERIHKDNPYLHITKQDVIPFLMVIHQQL